MKGYLQTGAWVVAAIVVLSAIGMSIEWFRRRGVQKWAQERGGTFEAGSFLAGVAVPEAAAFDEKAAPEDSVFHNVSRHTRPEASYVVAQNQRFYKDFKNNQQSHSCVVCFVTIPGAELPDVRVLRRVGGLGLSRLLGGPEPPAALVLPESTSEFASQFQVHPMSGETGIAAPALARLLPKAVQQELVSKEGLIAGLQVRGNVVRIQALMRETGYPHEEIFAFAQRLAAHWAAAVQR